MNISHTSYSFFNHRSTLWIPFFLFLLTITTIVFYLNFPSAYNQGIYHYQGLVLKNGGLPYTDFIEKKGPMGLLTYSLASILFGETAVAYRIFDLLILSITGFFLFRLIRIQYSKSFGWLACILWLQHILIDGPGNTADVTNIITACYVAAAYYLLTPSIKKRYFLLGILIALASWVKPTAFLIAIPFLFVVFRKEKDIINSNRNTIYNFILGMGIPSIIFILYLVISGTFYGFWEVVVVDTLHNYAGNVSRFSYRVIYNTGRTFLNDPLTRIGGLIGLFLFSKNTIIKCIVIGIVLMLFVEGRMFPYQFSILWPFLMFGIIEGVVILSRKYSLNKQKILIGVFSIAMAFPIFKASSTFIGAGFLTTNFDQVQTFIFPDFKDMYHHRKSVVAYLKPRITSEQEVFVLGIDPNIYLELETITTCRLAREGTILTQPLTPSLPAHLIGWQEEILSYMNTEKADWIIVLKKLQGKWSDTYKQEIYEIFSEKYKLDHTTAGHLIYKKI